MNAVVYGVLAIAVCVVVAYADTASEKAMERFSSWRSRRLLQRIDARRRRQIEAFVKDREIRP